MFLINTSLQEILNNASFRNNILKCAKCYIKREKNNNMKENNKICMCHTIKHRE